MNKQKKVLLFEPRIEGHHLFWLQLICECFLEQNYHVTIAIDNRTTQAQERIQDKNPHLLKQVSIAPLYNNSGKFLGGDKLNTLALCVKEYAIDEVFCTSLDEFTSSCFRKASFGIKPPPILKGKLSGVYHRPRPLDNSQKGLGNFIKRLGCNRLQKEGWFKNIFLLDPYLISKLNHSNCHFLPTFWDNDYSFDKQIAQQKLGIIKNQSDHFNKLIILHYGTPSKRKGLSLLLKALDNPSLQNKICLLAAGNITKDHNELKQLQSLESLGRAKILNYYISTEEEKLCFCAADFIALPYISHYGSSGILPIAAAAKRPVIASDYHMLGQSVTQNQLGIVFKNGNTDSLIKGLLEISSFSKNKIASYTPNLTQFAQANSKKAFKEAFIHGINKKF